jgi:3',5'-nucleoside bisphosphate phosphatase
LNNESNEFRADLHVHSHCSDGTDAPLELLCLAAKAGLRGLSITDHDTIQAYTPALWSQAREMNLELLRGVEISSEWQGLTVHILSYGFNDSLQEFLDQVLERRIERNRRMLEKLKKKGIEIDEKALHSSGPTQIVGRPHIAAAMVEKKAVASVQEAYDRYLKDDACCYAPGGKFTPGEVIDAVHAHSGLAILAHPHFLKKGHFLRDILALPLNGIECYYSRLPKQQETPWVQTAEKHHWLATGGSDYHGNNRPNIPIGASWVGEETFRKLVRHDLL